MARPAPGCLCRQLPQTLGLGGKLQAGALPRCSHGRESPGLSYTAFRAVWTHSAHWFHCPSGQRGWGREKEKLIPTNIWTLSLLPTPTSGQGGGGGEGKRKKNAQAKFKCFHKFCTRNVLTWIFLSVSSVCQKKLNSTRQLEYTP